MNTLLQNMITKLENLPETKQNSIANLVLIELEKDLKPQKQGCLDDVIDLVDQWLKEDAKYDEEVYAQLEINLLENTVSI